MNLFGRTKRLGLVALVIANALVITAQTTASASNKDSITVTLTMDKQEIPIGQSPWAILKVKNLTGHELPIFGNTYRVYVTGEKGDPPTTLAQRRRTGKLKPGEAAERTDEYVVWTVPPNESGIKKIQLAYLYDLSIPGKFTVYAEVADPFSHKWLRTNTVKFTMQASAP